MNQHLVITAVGTDRPGVCNQLIHHVTAAGCNIIDSRIAPFGNEFTLIMLISGPSPSITRVETTLPLLGQDLDLITLMKRTSEHTETNTDYKLDVVIESEDRIGLTEHVTQFFAERNIGLDALSARTISHRESDADTDQFHIAITASVGEAYNLMELQEQFDHFCSQFGIKGSLNFIKSSQ
ncbi:glycine cleavage system protein R [Vibrio sp. WXL210]|uniref:glycine cleavage system protein R n=1 Tax=Vibrio sp. WXL210 TaxID=3450709 RepID=UPI003EC5DF11